MTARSSGAIVYCLLSRSARLDLHHVIVGKPEMVPDFVHEHMGDDRAERLLILSDTARLMTPDCTRS
jgi:hypothetical protein